MRDHVLTKLHGAVENYKMPSEAKKLVLSSHMVVLCGVTASGKNTITNYLVEHDNFATVVSHTTRRPRSNHGQLEQNGLDYWFVSPEEMLKLVEDEAFVEIKTVHGDTCYGTSIAAIRTATRDGRVPIIEIDVQGAVELMQAIPNLRPLFVLPPSYEVWMERLGTRGFMSDGEKGRRFNSARHEIETALTHSSFTLVVNHEVAETAVTILKGGGSGLEEQNKNRLLAEELLAYVK